MANLVRRIRDREPTLFRRFDPFRSVWDLMRWDLFRDLMRWDPFGEVPRFERPWGTSYLLEMEVKETPDAFVIHADVPGVEEKDIDVSIAGNVLTVSGKREEEARDEGDQYVSHERSYGSFCRSFTLPEGSDAENVGADLKNGVLTVTVPKKADVRSHRIPIGAKAKKAEPQLEANQQAKAA
ncbi:Hsp20/alpha crystallin family protein [Sorangium sp. So ce302]|uniref:Hsp20/alpha crystallin family protein n=1 Tax=Sorangium sp. So ce302 TaxID=3133297 RepID=UPI003F5E278B